MIRFLRTMNKPSIAALLAVLLLASAVTAGSLTPPGSPSSTMNTLAEIFDSIAGTFDSSSVVADQNGSLIEHLKYIEDNMGTGDGVGSDSLDFDEFVDAMTLDADTSIASAGFVLTTDANVGIGTAAPIEKFEVAGGNILLSQEDPEEIASVGDGQNIAAIALSGNYAFVGDFTALNVKAYDITVPSSPQLLSTFAQGCTTFLDSNIISSKYIFVSCSASGLRIYDFTNIASPSLLSTIPNSQTSFPSSVAISGKYLYVAGDFVANNLHVFDISD